MPVAAIKQHTARRRVSLLGVTGSIGMHATALLKHHSEQFEVVAVTAHRNVELLAERAIALQARYAVIADEQLYAALCTLLEGSGVEAMAGEAAVSDAAALPADLVLSGIMGFAGLKPTLAAMRQGTTVALANKECLVAAGPVFMEALKAHNAMVLPVDSEHNAIFQVLDNAQHAQVEKLILTASGGPFRTTDPKELVAVTPAQAVNHPNWDMGVKISVDSATMMNKGLELIEAHYLFAMPPTQLEVLVHPESIIHSMVQYCDGSVLAQLGPPDMTTPIAYALGWPERIDVPQKRLNLAELGSLHFEAPDIARFPCLQLALEALAHGGAMPTVLNAANEVAVAAFLSEKVGFMDIPRIVEQTMHQLSAMTLSSLEDVFTVDAAARDAANTHMTSLAR